MVRKIIAEPRELQTVAENNTLTSTEFLLSGEGIKLFRMCGDTGHFIRGKTAASLLKKSERTVVTTKGSVRLRIYDADEQVTDDTRGVGVNSGSRTHGVGTMVHEVLEDGTEWFCLITDHFKNHSASLISLDSGDELPAVPDNPHIIYALIEGTVNLDGVAVVGPTLFLDDPDAASPGVITCTTGCTFIRVIVRTVEY